MIETLNNDTNITEIYSKEMKKVCEIENATIENNIEYIRIYNDQENKYISMIVNIDIIVSLFFYWVKIFIE